MKYLFALSALLASTATAIFEPPEVIEVCTVEKRLILDKGSSNEKDIGFYKVTEVNNGQVTVLAKLTIDGIGDRSDDLTYPYIKKVQAQICCDSGEEANPLCSDLMDYADLTDETDKEISFTFDECQGDVWNDIKLRVHIEDPGGPIAFNQLFPAGSGMAVKFKVGLDGGPIPGSSYLGATFSGANVPEALIGRQFDGYCIDRGNGISTREEYDALAYSFLDIDWANAEKWASELDKDVPGDNVIGFIDKPWNLPAVAYCVNHWRPGASYTVAGEDPEPYTLSSGTLQKAIWAIVDDTEWKDGCPGCGDSDISWAEHIAADCISKGLAPKNPNDGRGVGGDAARDYMPGCDDWVPIVVIPTKVGDHTIQNQYVLLKYADLGLSCYSEVLHVDAETYCTTGGSGESGGDPHFRTFGGQWFDFHGGCDLLLASFPDFGAGLGLTVEVRTTTRYDYSFIESAAIQIGEDILEISSFGQYMLNSLSKPQMPLLLGEYIVEYTQPRKNQHLFTIDLGDKKSITVKVYKDLVYVNLNVHDGDNFDVKNGVGMLGTWMEGTRLARDGVTVLEDDIEFGQEWQVQDTDAQLFTTTRAPQWPTKCEMPNPVERASRRLGENTVSLDKATSACAHIKNAHHHDMCVYDVIATADLSVAQGGAY